MTEPQDKGELEYGSILPNGEDWRLRKFDAGMGETEYRISRNEKFFAMFDNREDADTVMGLMTHSSATSAEKVLESILWNRIPYLPAHGYEGYEMLVRLSDVKDMIAAELRQQEKKE